jgi:hypothetical protein
MHIYKAGCFSRFRLNLLFMGRHHNIPPTRLILNPNFYILKVRGRRFAVGIQLHVTDSTLFSCRLFVFPLLFLSFLLYKKSSFFAFYFFCNGKFFTSVIIFSFHRHKENFFRDFPLNFLYFLVLFLREETLPLFHRNH